jgi:hypothetical protein
MDAALTFPQALATLEDFVRLVRGQVFVRIAAAELDANNADGLKILRILSKGIDDLRAAYEVMPQKYGMQDSLPCALARRAELLLRDGRYDEARADAAYLLAHADLCAAAPPQAVRAGVTQLLADLREADDAQDFAHIESLLPAVMAHPGCSELGLITVALAVRHLFAQKPADATSALLEQALALFEAEPIETVAHAGARRMHLSLAAGLALMLGERWAPAALEKAVDFASRAVETDPAAPSAE